MKYYDEDSYRFHKKDSPKKCFCCGRSASRLLVVRHVESQMMVHLCPECMVERSDDYLLDNTRPWLGPRKKD